MAFNNYTKNAQVSVSECNIRVKATNRIVVDLRTSPTEMRLYACHISSDSSGIRTTYLQKNKTLAVNHPLKTVSHE